MYKRSPSQASMMFVSALLASIAFAQARAQTFPVKPVHIVVGLPPGASIDTLARGVSQELSRTWSHPVIVDNRVGAGDIIAATAVAKSTRFSIKGAVKWPMRSMAAAKGTIMSFIFQLPRKPWASCGEITISTRTWFGS